jgi:hypothetical protein
MKLDFLTLHLRSFSMSKENIVSNFLKCSSGVKVESNISSTYLDRPDSCRTFARTLFIVRLNQDGTQLNPKIALRASNRSPLGLVMHILSFQRPIPSWRKPESMSILYIYVGTCVTPLESCCTDMTLSNMWFGVSEYVIVFLVF